MDLEPKTIRVSSAEELRAKAFEHEKSGRRVIDCNVFEEGLIGKLSFILPPEGKASTWTPQEADATWIVWEKFGRMLQPEKTQVQDGTEMFKLFGEHKNHQIVGFTNSMDKSAGFVCFCKAEEGKSLVFTVDMSNAKELPPELKASFEPLAQVIDPKIPE